MPKKSQYSFEEYRKEFEYYRFEFLKRSNWEEDRKNEYRQLCPDADPNSIQVLWNLYIDSQKNPIRQLDIKEGKAKLKFIFEVSKYATIDELKAELDNLKEEVEEIWRDRKIQMLILDYQRDKRGRKYPFDQWKKCLAVYDARRANPNITLLALGNKLKADKILTCAIESLEATIIAYIAEAESLILSAYRGTFPD